MPTLLTYEGSVLTLDPKGELANVTARRRDGSEVPVEISLSPVYSDDDRYVAATVRDGDVCISMGCGDIASLPDEVLAARRGNG